MGMLVAVAGLMLYACVAALRRGQGYNGLSLEDFSDSELLEEIDRNLNEFNSKKDNSLFEEE